MRSQDVVASLTFAGLPAERAMRADSVRLQLARVHEHVRDVIVAAGAMT